MKTRAILSRVMVVRFSRAAIFSAFITLLSAAGFPGSTAYADSVIFNDFLSGSTYNGNSAWSIGAYDSSASMLFTALTTADVSQIDIALYRELNESTGPNQATVSLYTDNNNALGTLLGTWTITGLPNCCTNNSATTISVSPGLQLTAGSSYFLYASAASGLVGGWNLSGNNNGGGTTTGSVLLGDYGLQTHATLGAFEIVGSSISATPLPSTWLMLLSGFVGLGFLAYRGTKKNSAAIAAA